MQKPNAGASLPKRKTTPCSLVGAYVIPRTVICLPTSSSLLIAGVPRYNVLSFHNWMLTGTQVPRVRPDECNFSTIITPACDRHHDPLALEQLRSEELQLILN